MPLSSMLVNWGTVFVQVSSSTAYYIKHTILGLVCDRLRVSTKIQAKYYFGMLFSQTCIQLLSDRQNSHFYFWPTSNTAYLIENCFLLQQIQQIDRRSYANKVAYPIFYLIWIVSVHSWGIIWQAQECFIIIIVTGYFKSRKRYNLLQGKLQLRRSYN